MTTLALASTMYGAATLAAAFDEGLGDASGERVLVVANNSPTAEVVPSFDQIPAFAGLAGSFDRVVDLNEVLAPFHPSSWWPQRDDTVMWAKLLRATWGLDDEPLALLVESIQVAPAQSLCRVFADAPITVYADGLMSYGPTRTHLDAGVATRIQELWHPDLVPGLRPLLLSEHGVGSRTIPLASLRARLEPLATPGDREAYVPQAGRRALVVGQYLSSLGLLTPAEETEVYVRMVTVAAHHGATDVAFKPHPSDAPSVVDRLERAAVERGMTFTLVASRSPVEALVPLLRPAMVIGCFSTALVTVRTMFGVPAFTVAADLLLKRLRPYANSNRIPLVLVRAIIPSAADDGAPAGIDAGAGASAAPCETAELQDLLTVVGYCMQPTRYEHLRPAATAALAAGRVELGQLSIGHLTRLGLPHGHPLGRVWQRVRTTPLGRMIRRRRSRLRNSHLAHLARRVGSRLR